MEDLGSIRKRVKEHREISNKEKDHDYFRVDRAHTSGYFEILPEWRQKVRQFFHKVHEKGEKVVYVDVCGRTSADDLGADKSYCFSLQASEITKSFRPIMSKTTEFVDGDLFNAEDFDSLIQTLKERKESPALITFMPMAGLQSHGPRDSKSIEAKVTYAMLEKRFRSLYSILKPGGFILLEKPFQMDSSNWASFFRGVPQTEYEISKHFKKLAEELGFELSIESQTTGPYFLIRKPLRKKRKVRSNA